MKRPKIKQQRKGRKKPPKKRNPFLNKLIGANKAYFRRFSRGNEKMPHSTKIGAGEIVARRNLPHDALHKRNHRSNEMVGNSYKIIENNKIAS